MRFTYFLILLLQFSLLACAQEKTNEIPTSTMREIDCPLEGSAKTDHLKELNKLKNRTSFPADSNFNPKISLTAILVKGNDTERWSVKSAAKVIGYVKDVKPGGVETVNCKTKDKRYRDTHIELVLDPMNEEKNKVFVIEVTPRIRKIMAEKGEDWSTSMIRSKYLGRWVEVEGWMFYDTEHANMAENTKPGNPKNWRATAWEIHPVTKLKVVVKH